MRILTKVLLMTIRAYQRTLSPDHGIFSYRHPHGYCRYTPTCSQYAYDAIARHGPFRGTGKALYRVLRCNPFSRGGYDPVQS